MHFFFNDYLVGDIVILFDKDYHLTKELEAEFKFLCGNVEDLLYKHHIAEENQYNDMLFDVAEPIISSRHYQNQDTGGFMSRLLDLAFEIGDEADYGSAMLYENGFWSFTHAIGHNYERLSKLNIKNDAFDYGSDKSYDMKEVSPNIFLINNILDEKAQDEFTPDDIKELMSASLPIKQTLQLFIYFDGMLKGVISLDIKQGSEHCFTIKSLTLL
jgi:hypothetical protein